MTLLKGLTFTSVVRTNAVTPEQHRRNKLIAHLQEQLAIARADVAGSVHVVRKRRWEHTESGEKHLIEVNKRLKRWWSKAADDKIVLGVRWGSKCMEFEKGKAGIVISDMAGLIVVLEKLIAATEAGDMDAMIAAMNKQRMIPKKRAA